MRLTAKLTIVVLLSALIPAAAPAVSSAAGSGRALGGLADQARVGGRGFGRVGRPVLGQRRAGRRTSRRPVSRRPLRRRPILGHGFWRGVLRALGIAYLVHLLFGWGAGGGSPLGLLIVFAAILWLATRRRRRARAYW